MKKKLFWQLFPSYLLVVFIPILINSWYATKELKQCYLNQVKSDLKARAVLLEDNIKQHFYPLDSKYINSLCKKYGKSTKMRITVILPSGKVIADSDENPDFMNNHKNRPEIISAILGHTGNIIRYSKTLNKEMMYVAVPIPEKNKTIGVVRTSVPLLFVEKVLKSICYKIIIEGIIVILIAVFISFFISRRISKPLEELVIGANEFADGNLKYNLPVTNTKEIDSLANAMNKMAFQFGKLENIRRDFIANVSHELRTPITSIKGYAETLMDGAIQDRENAERFVNIILNHTNRLNNIIEDLLSLSRLEQDPEKSELVFEKTRIINILESAIQICLVKAESKNIRLNLVCLNDIYAIINPSLIEQAVLNLIDNAIKYSPSESEVIIEALQEDNEIIIKVIDYGCGIPEEHLSRIFERFYRVDKARSRKLGGTGLGLSIVKHISQVHGGYTKAESTINAGSIFSIHLPAH